MYQTDTRKKIVFLGTPQVACCVLESLLGAGSFHSKVVLVVSQPPARSSRSRELLPSPVHALAYEKGVPVLTPDSAKDPQFLSDLEALAPDICVTAAYGNYLPERFLKIPKYGTVNIHPSLLPLYRGASPVQRTLENGDALTGVSLLYSVREMDAGPLLAQESLPVEQDIKSPQLLEILFKRGAKLLVKNLPAVYANTLVSQEQNAAHATHALKLTVEESVLDFSKPALVLHNKVRAFTPWPSTRCSFFIENQSVECKILTTSVHSNEAGLALGSVVLKSDSIDVCCGDGLILRILELQPTGKKAMQARDFINGLRFKALKLVNQA